MTRDVLDERIVTSIEVLWKSILEIRGFASRFTFFQSILVPKEYADVISGKARGVVPHISRQEFDKQSTQLLTHIEDARPFVGESIWALYSTCRAFAVRQALKVQDGLEKEKLHEWNKDFEGRQDMAVQQLLHTAFSEEELSLIIQHDGLGATANIISALEFKILKEMNEWVFNRKYHAIDLAREQNIQNLTTVLGDMRVSGDVVGRDKSTTDNVSGDKVGRDKSITS
jgi:hypothetical protein